MAKDPRHQQNIIKRYYEHQDTIQSNKLSELVSELWLATDDKTKVKLWGKTQIALMRLGVDATRVAKVVGARDLEALATLVAQADAGTVPPAASSSAGTSKSSKAPITDTRTIGQMKAQKAAEGGYDSLEEPNLKRAMRAFRKKLKITRQDDESRLGSRYVTSGRVSNICAITPPNQYPQAVWDKLVELGRLKRGGQGTCELP